MDQFLMNQNKLRLGFLFVDLFQHFGIYLVAFAPKFYSWIKGDKYFKLCVYTPNMEVVLGTRSKIMTKGYLV